MWLNPRICTAPRLKRRHTSYLGDSKILNSCANRHCWEGAHCQPCVLLLFYIVFVNAAEHTVPGFRCGDGASSLCGGWLTRWVWLFFIGCWGKKKSNMRGPGECSEVSDLVHCCDRGEREQWSLRGQKVYILSTDTVAAQRNTCPPVGRCTVTAFRTSAAFRKWFGQLSYILWAVCNILIKTSCERSGPHFIMSWRKMERLRPTEKSTN